MKSLYEFLNANKPIKEKIDLERLNDFFEENNIEFLGNDGSATLVYKYSQKLFDILASLCKEILEIKQLYYPLTPEEKNRSLTQYKKFSDKLYSLGLIKENQLLTIEFLLSTNREIYYVTLYNKNQTEVFFQFVISRHDDDKNHKMSLRVPNDSEYQSVYNVFKYILNEKDN